MIEWLEAHMGACVFVKYLHMECPGCGTQRAFIALLKGDVIQSIKLYPALLPYLMTIAGLVLQLIFKWKQGGVWLMYGFVFSTIVMVASYLVRLLS